MAEMVAMSPADLGQIDPVVMNLVVAKGVPALAELDIVPYVQLADRWARVILDRREELEAEFHKTPQDWRNDPSFFRLSLVCWLVDNVLGMAYREDQREVTRIHYTDPTDLFINGVMDTRRGSCANLSLLHVVLGRRIGLPVSLACIASHYLCRYDDGRVTYNVETTDTGRGGFSSQTDEFILTKHKVSPQAVYCGSDLRAVTPHEMLGLFLGNRARHFENTDRFDEAERDYLLARHLFPANRQLYIAQNQVSVQQSMKLFDPGEKGHPVELAQWLQQVVHAAPWKNPRSEFHRKQENLNDCDADEYFRQIGEQVEI